MSALVLGLALSTSPPVDPLDEFRMGLQELQDRLVRARIDVLPPRSPMELFHGLFVRQGTSMLSVGLLPGKLLGWRLGAETHGITAYTVVGGGSFTAFRHEHGGREADPASITTRSMPYGFVGLGAELRLHRTVFAAAELDWGRLATGDRRVLAPDPGELVSTAVFALRIAY